jgi:peptidoglycan/LPS O-acetylase OafA/YrhL
MIIADARGNAADSSFGVRLGQFARQIKADFWDLFERDDRESYAALDGLRALAVLWVIAFHIMLLLAVPLNGNPYAKADSILSPTSSLKVWRYLLLISSGDLGVDIFFVLSGFLIADILIRDLAKRRLSAGTFLRRRFIRIVPAYFFTILVYMAGATLVDTDADGCRKNWWKNLLFVNNMVRPLLTKQADDSSSACVPQTWSIAVEFQFYLISPALMLWLVSAPAAEWRRAFWPWQNEGDASNAGKRGDMTLGLMANAINDSSSSAFPPTAHEPFAPLTADELSTALATNFRWKMAGLVVLGLCSLTIQAILYATNVESRGNLFSMLVFLDDYVYVRTYCRVVPYLVGIACAVYFHAFGKREISTYVPASENQADEFASPYASWYQRALKYAGGWDLDSSALLLTLGVNVVFSYLGPGTKGSVEQDPAFDIFTADQIFLSFFARVAFGCCLGYQVYLCLVGRGQLLNRFLSSRIWLPFARLSFSAYLMQFAIMSWLFQLKSLVPALAFDPAWNSLQAYCAALVTIVAFTCLIFVLVVPSYLLIEKTCMRLR